MRRIFLLVAVLLLLTLPVSASGAEAGELQATVQSDGSCEVSLILQLQIDTVSTDLSFPLPAAARDVTVNGVSVKTTSSGNARHCSLSGIITTPGQYTLNFHYRLEDTIATDENGDLLLTLDLLCGFDYAIEAFRFRVTLPGQPEARPHFSSTYFQDGIETMITLSSQGNCIEGQMDQRLQDHETLTMTLTVSEEMFPQPVAKRWSMDTTDLLMLGLAALAAVYWLLTMSQLPPKRLRRTTAPDGITAGETGCVLSGRGVDFTLMVLSWAQMGYLLIQPEANGRVLLHKRMEMGNERDDFEIQAFRKLFGRRDVVDGTGHHYARLCRRFSAIAHGARRQFLPASGNPKLLRILAALVGTVSGVSLATAFAGGSGWHIPLSMVLAAAGFLTATAVQDIALAIHSHKRLCLLCGTAAAIVWLLLSYAAGEWNVAMLLLPGEWIAGIAALHTGRRSETGKIQSSELRGLRHYLKTITPEEMERNLRIDPNYFYDLAPFALALGVDHAFARSLRQTRLPQCPYLTTGMDGHLTAIEWTQLLRKTVNSLDALQHRLPVEQLLRK